MKQRDSMNSLYLPKSRIAKLIKLPNSVGMLPSRRLKAAFGNIGGTSKSKKTKYLEHKSMCV